MASEFFHGFPAPSEGVPRGVITLPYGAGRVNDQDPNTIGLLLEKSGSEKASEDSADSGECVHITPRLIESNTRSR